METVFERWVDCGITPEQLKEVPEKMGQSFLKGKGALLTIERGCPCKECGGKDQEFVFLEKKVIPKWLRVLLDQSVGEGEKKK